MRNLHLLEIQRYFQNDFIIRIVKNVNINFKIVFQALWCHSQQALYNLSENYLFKKSPKDFYNEGQIVSKYSWRHFCSIKSQTTSLLWLLYNKMNSSGYISRNDSNISLSFFANRKPHRCLFLVNTEH